MCYVLDGDLMVGEVRCGPGTAIMLRKGTVFGPLIAGEKGTLLLEVFIGPNARQERG